MLALACGMLLADHDAVHARAAPRPERQLLVMLHLPAPHLRAGSDYAGNYGDDPSRAGRRRIAAGIASRHGLELVDNWPMPLIGVDCFIMTVPESRSVADAAGMIAREPAVEWSQPVNMFEGRASGGDPLYAAQPAAGRWHLADLHRFATGRGVTVAVVDSKIDVGHPDLAGRIAMAEDFTTGRSAAAENHGTGIAGIIAADGDNGIGVVGIAPGARLMALRACWQVPVDQRGASAGDTVCDSLSLAKAIQVAIQRKAQIVNLSLSGPQDRLLATLLTLALARRATIVAAVDRHQPDGGFPASMRGVVAVSDDPAVQGDVYVAPGRDVPTTVPGGRWSLVNGSSFATAHVSGLMALVREHGAMRPGSLVSARRRGGEVDACATVMPKGRHCG